MTGPTDELVRIAQRSQEAVAAAVLTWTEAARHYAETCSADQPLPQPADAQAAVDAYYDLAESLLADQRALASALLGAGSQAADALAEQARAVAEAAPFPLPPTFLLTAAGTRNGSS